MNINDVPFTDDEFKAAVLATGCTDTEQVIEIRARKSGLQNLDGLNCFPNLRLLDATRNQITEVDLTGNPLLEELYLGNNELETLDLSANTELRHLEIFINDISVLDVSMLTKLENLYANKNDLNELDLTANPNLEELQFSDNEVTELALAAECKPFIVKAQHNQLSSSTVAQLEALVPAENLKL